MIIPLSIAFAISLTSMALGFIVARSKYLAQAEEVLTTIKHKQHEEDMRRGETLIASVQSAYAVGYKDGQKGEVFAGKVTN